MVTDRLDQPRRGVRLVPVLSAGYWMETGCVAGAAALVLLWANRAAFAVPFFGENFQHLGMFQHLGHCLACLLAAPTLDGWYRPVDAVFTVLSHLVLPPRPFPFHLRNWLLLLVNLVLFHRVLLHLVPQRGPRLLAVAFVAVSKVHFTLIGYINNFGGILVTTWVLLAALGFVRFIRHGRPRDYALVLVASALSLFTKETGLAVLVVLAALVASYARPGRQPAVPARRLVWSLLPVALIVAAFFALRTVVAGTPLQTTEFYAPRLSLAVVQRDAEAFSAALANVAWVAPEVMGAGGLAAWLAARWGLRPSLAVAADKLVVALLFAGVAALGLRARARWRQWVLPLAWMGVTLAMVLTIRNLQLYYTYDFVLAFGVLLALLLVGAARPVQWWAAGAIVLIGVNGLVSGAAANYGWQRTAERAAEATRRLAAVCGPPPACGHLALVTARVPEWMFVLGAAPPGAPLLPELLGRPDLRLTYHAAAAYAANPLPAAPGRVIVALDDDFTVLPGGEAVVGTAPLILNFGPARAQAGQPFNVQANGAPALWFQVERATPDTVVVFDGAPLVTTVASNLTAVTARLDVALFSRPGRYELYLRNQAGPSNRVFFEVEAAP